jgi:hypothetical protein
MDSEMVTALRRRVSVASLALWGLLFAVTVTLAERPQIIVAIAAAYLAVAGIRVSRDIPGTDERRVKAGVGLLIVAAGVGWLLSRASTAETALLSGLVAVAGGWLALDARADLVDGRRAGETLGESADGVDSTLDDPVRFARQTNRLSNELEERPKTVSELASACDLTESRVRDLVALAGQDGTIRPVDPDSDDPRYALDDRQVGLGGVGRKVTAGTKGALGRLIRPLTALF